MFGTKLHDILEVTGWDERFITELSYGINEEITFFSGEKFSGWPVIDLPIQKRPFIKLEGKYYCFDYYAFMDNFYRVIQKTIMRLEPQYDWSKRQQLASEKMTEDVFIELLPGCYTYSENYYPYNGSIKQPAENDLIVLYFNTLIIVEVKAGSFVYTPPLTDYEAHITSYKALIEKADWQCKRMYDYLISTENPSIYDKEHKVKVQLDMSKITDIYMMSVTIDNINDFAARAEKLNFLQLKCNAISISIDDLMVYRDYFNSSLMFLHFLKQRRLATLDDKIALNDELDHLGMYISHNCYSFQTREIPKNTKMQWVGYREELDKYFSSLYHPQLSYPKPLQNIPSLFMDIIVYLVNSDLENKVEVSNYLLDFCFDAKSDLCEKVQDLLERQFKNKKPIAIHTAGTGSSLSYTCFVNQPELLSYSKDEKRKYVLASVIKNQENERILLDLYFDKNNKFLEIIFRRFTYKDINKEEKDELFLLGEEIAKRRLVKYKSSNPGKIGRNQFCPCGSGKKFKRCCGR